MRRAPIVLVATVIGTTGVLMFKPREVTPSVASSSSSTASQGATVSKSGSTSIATGAAASTRFGNTQVRVTIKGGKITDIKPLQIPSNEPQSVQISNGAVPTLRESALSKQSAAIDSVSGATITSKSYAASLQSALDKAGFTAADGSTAPPRRPPNPRNTGTAADSDTAAPSRARASVSGAPPGPGGRRSVRVAWRRRWRPGRPRRCAARRSSSPGLPTCAMSHIPG
ncbi:FMN-binding protein [Streptomyces avermitilis]|uniref:FMN-binding protein n=1 Tax=Streptomyces avermitilis TaxID=33903 RepID=UPI0033D3115E